MGENNTCCTWKVDTNWGKREPTVWEYTYQSTAGYWGLAYKCATCTKQQIFDLIKNIPSAGWAGNIG